MKLFPAIDLKEGKCVRLSKGKEESSIIYNDDPVEQAKIIEDQGCQRIHIVDLDAAFGNKKNNKSTILNIRKSTSVEIQLGGGIKTESDVSFWLENGINFLICGSLAITNHEVFIKLVSKFSDNLYVSVDDYNGKAMINGWTKNSNFTTKEIFENYNDSEIRGFILTDVSRDGMLEGIDILKIKKCLKYSKKPIIVGGGLSSNNEIKTLSQLNDPLLEGVIAGKSFYQKKIDINAIKEFLD